MWRFFGVLLLSCIVEADVVDVVFKEIKPCSPDDVCLLYIRDQCNVNGVKTVKEHVGIVLRSNTAVCDAHTMDRIWARLDFDLKSERTWSVQLTTYCKIEDIEFKFDHAELKFLSSSEVLLVWGKDEEGQAVFPVRFVEEVEVGVHGTNWISRRPHLFVYKFVMTLEDKKLISLLGGSQVEYKRVRNLAACGDEEVTSIKMTEKLFPYLINEKTPCDFNDIKITCIGGCDPIAKVDNTAVCETKLWFYKTAADKNRRQWKEITDLKCHMGQWEGKVEGGKQVIDASYSVQCDKKMPKKMTGQLKAIIGFSVGGGILVLLLLIGLFIYCYRKKNANANNKDTFRGGSNSKAGTPSKRWDLSNSKAGTPV